MLTPDFHAVGDRGVLLDRDETLDIAEEMQQRRETLQTLEKLCVSSSALERRALQP